jgi:hypothetical protein
MAVEDHPVFPEWKKAYDEMLAIRDEYEMIPASATGPAAKRRMQLWHALNLAFARIDAIARKIDGPDIDDGHY